MNQILKTDSPATKRQGEIRTHSLILLRWFAVFGQLIGIGVTIFGLGFPLPLYECLILIGILAISNLFLAISTNRTNRLSNYHTARLLAFDMTQLTALFFFTGGLENPFTLSILVPVTISATLLSRGATIMLTIFALFCATFLAFYHMPLPWQGSLMDLHTGRISKLYLAGIWIALALAILLVAIYLWSLTEEARATSEALKETETALSKEKSFSTLGSLAAAAAHELSTPLSTITLISKEILYDLPPNSPLKDDILLLYKETLRCRDILTSLHQTPQLKSQENEAFEKVSLSYILEKSAQENIYPPITHHMEILQDSIGAEPLLYSTPELRHSLANLYSNATFFAQKHIQTYLFWNQNKIIIQILDDGPGFPRHILERLGDPYISTRSGQNGHMGLGLFITKTLLNRISAHITFHNRSDTSGAKIRIEFNHNKTDQQ